MGSIAERGRIVPALIFTFIWTTLIYDPIAVRQFLLVLLQSPPLSLNSNSLIISSASLLTIISTLHRDGHGVLEAGHFGWEVLTLVAVGRCICPLVRLPWPTVSSSAVALVMVPLDSFIVPTIHLT